MKIRLHFSSLILATATLPLLAQTPATTTHHATPVHHYAATAGCAKLPEISPKIPALPSGTPCAKALYTLTRTPDTHLDYASPLVGPELREELSSDKATYSLDYIDTEIGTGPLAEPHKWYTVHYTGYLANGTKFDSSLDRGEPISFPYGQHRVIQGWDTGFAGMHIGGKRRLFVPYELAYGENGRPPVIPAKAELIFDVELIAQSDEQPKPKTPPMQRQPFPSQPGARPSTAPGARPAATPPAGSTTTPPTGTTTAPAAKPQQ